MDIHQLKQRIDASGKKPRPITDQCALTVLVWVHIKMNSEEGF